MNRPWNSILGKAVYLGIQALRGEPVNSALKELESTQAWSLERLRTLQWHRLKMLLEHAYRIPFYRARFDAAGLRPASIHGPADYERLPVLTRDDIRRFAPAMRADGLRERASLLTTSGSSGTPLSIGRSRVSTAYARAAMYRAHRWHGLDIGDREMRLWGQPLETKSRRREALKDLLMNRYRMNVFDLAPERLRAFYAEIQRRKPWYLFGYASLIDFFGRFVEENGYDGRALGLHAVKTTSEPLREEQRRRLERIFGCSVLNEYGCTESGVIAATCPQGGMHASLETVYAECIPLADSPFCRVLVTDLHNRSMPLLRYDVGDMVELPTVRSCVCGGNLPLFGTVVGRKTEIIEVAGGKKVHSLLLYYILCGLEERGLPVHQARLIQQSPAQFLCQIRADESCASEAKSIIHQQLATSLGREATIRVETVAAIPRLPNGKHSDFVRAF